MFVLTLRSHWLMERDHTEDIISPITTAQTQMHAEKRWRPQLSLFL